MGSFSSLLENSTIIGNNIPLKIVHQTNHHHHHHHHNNNNSSDENSRHDSPTNINYGNGGRVRRKSSHNAIEKRYRSSINERILELKEMVADNDEKVDDKYHSLINENSFRLIRYKNLVFYDVQLNIFDNFSQLIDD